MKRALAIPLLLASVVIACSSSSGDGGGASGPVLTPLNGPVDPAAAAKAAVLLGSCIPDDGANRILDRIYGFHEGDPSADYERNAVPCLATKTNGCQGVTECTGVTVDTVDTCAPGCSGDRLTECDGSVRFQIDCARLGAKCVASADGKPTCSSQGGTACSPDSFSPTCENGRPVYCPSGVRLLGPVCSDFNADCGIVPGSDNSSVCHGRGTVCPGTIGPGEIQYVGLACGDSSSLHACLNGQATDVACGTFGAGFACQSSSDGVFFCGQGAECTPGSKRATCDGTNVVLCNAGRTQPVDCKTLGFTSCANGGCVK